MALNLRLEFFGDVQLDRTLERFGENVGDARPVWNAMADDFARLETRQFASEGAFASGGWSPLSPRYASWKAKNYPGQPILQREGDLVRSLTTRPFGVEVITPRQMVVGSDVDYGAFHQLGDGVPRRRPVELREVDRQRWMRALQRFVVTGEADL